jgi:hypothetical protein
VLSPVTVVTSSAPHKPAIWVPRRDHEVADRLPTACGRFDADPEPNWPQGHSGQHRYLRGVKGQIAAGFPEPETLTSHARRTQPQVTAMISVPSAAPESTSHSAGGASGGHFRATLSPDTRSKNIHDLEPPYGIEP